MVFFTILTAFKGLYVCFLQNLKFLQIQSQTNSPAFFCNHFLFITHSNEDRCKLIIIDYCIFFQYKTFSCKYFHKC